jgi:hypothetical protein
MAVSGSVSGLGSIASSPNITGTSEDGPNVAKLPPTAKLEWPLFPSPSISLLHLSGYQIYNSTPFYVIVIGMSGGFKWSVLKSYDEIALLHKQVFVDGCG